MNFWYNFKKYSVFSLKLADMLLPVFLLVVWLSCLMVFSASARWLVVQLCLTRGAHYSVANHDQDVIFYDREDTGAF